MINDFFESLKRRLRKSERGPPWKQLNTNTKSMAFLSNGDNRDKHFSFIVPFNDVFVVDNVHVTQNELLIEIN